MIRIVYIRSNESAQSLGFFYPERLQHPGKLFTAGTYLTVAADVIVPVGEEIVITVFVLVGQFKGNLVRSRALVILLEDEHPGLAGGVQVLPDAAVGAVGPHQIAAVDLLSGQKTYLYSAIFPFPDFPDAVLQKLAPYPQILIQQQFSLSKALRRTTRISFSMWYLPLYFPLMYKWAQCTGT